MRTESVSEVFIVKITVVDHKHVPDCGRTNYLYIRYECSLRYLAAKQLSPKVRQQDAQSVDKKRPPWTK